VIGMAQSHRDWGYLGAWAVSLTLHSILAGVVALSSIWWSNPPEQKFFQWEVMLVTTTIKGSSQMPTGSSMLRQITSSPKTPLHSTEVVPVAPSHTEQTPVPTPASPTETEQPDHPIDMASPEPSPDTSESMPSTFSETTTPANVLTAEVTPVTATIPNPDWLVEALWRQIEALKRYPYLARRNGWEGQVVVKAIIRNDGYLVHAEIERSSGYRILDQDALQLVRNSTPIRMEQLQSWNQKTISIPITYRLQQ